MTELSVDSSRITQMEFREVEKNVKRGGPYFLKLGVGLAALCVLAAVLRPGASEARQLLPLLKRADARWIAAAFFCQLGVYFALAGVLRAALSAFGRALRLTVLFPVSVVFLFANRALPGPAVAGLASLTLLLGRRGVTSSEAQAIAATFYAADYVSFFALALIALGILGARDQLGPLHPAVLFFALFWIVFLAAAVIFLLRSPVKLKRAASKIARFFRQPPEKGNALTEEFLTRWQSVTAGKKTRAAACAWAGAMHAAEVGTLLCAARAFGEILTPDVGAAGYVGANLAAIVSFLPGGLGFYEGTMTAAFHVIGRQTLAAALGTTLLYRVLSIWLPIPLALTAMRGESRPSPPGPLARSAGEGERKD